MEVGLHQGSTISPYIFALILDDLSRGIQKSIPWCMIFIDDIMLVAEYAKGLNKRLEHWDVIPHNEEVDIHIDDQILHSTESFRYLGSVIHKSRRIDDDITHRIRAWWVGNKASYLVRVRVLTDHKSSSKQGGSGKIENAKVNLWWFGHVMIRLQQAPVRRVETLIVDGTKRRDRLKLRCDDKLKLDIKKLFLYEDMTSYKNAWRDMIRICG
ncbi:ataxia telangiectasia mutated family protein [Tanacetum coccineum]